MSGITPSSGDVFKDLGFSAAEAEDLRLRSDLLIELKNRIVATGDPQRVTADRLGISQPRVSDLLRGRIDKFSLDMLALFLRRLGASVQVVVESDDDNLATLRREIESTATAGRAAWTTQELEHAARRVAAAYSESVDSAVPACDTALAMVA